MTPFNVPGLGAGEEAVRYLGISYQQAAEALSHIASGQRITRAADDPAGLAVSESLRAELRGMQREALNALDQIGAIQTAEGGAGEIHGALQRINELSIQAGSSILTAEDRAAIQLEVEANLEHIETVAQTTQFNEQQLLTGALGGDMGAAALGVAGLDVTTPEGAQAAIGATGEAIGRVSEFRTGLGALQGGLESRISALDVGVENLMAAESRIRDADIAAESVKLTGALVRAQAGIAALAQANLLAKSVASLLIT